MTSWSNGTALSTMIPATAKSSTKDVVNNLLEFASNMQHRIFVGSPAFFPGAGLLFAASLLLLIPTECCMGRLKKKSTSLVLFCSHITITTFWLAAAWAFASALATIQAVMAQEELVKFTGCTDVKMDMGIAVQCLQWAAFLLTALFAAGMTALRIKQGKSIRGVAKVPNSHMMSPPAVAQQGFYGPPPMVPWGFVPAPTSPPGVMSYGTATSEVRVNDGPPASPLATPSSSIVTSESSSAWRRNCSSVLQQSPLPVQQQPNMAAMTPSTWMPALINQPNSGPNQPAFRVLTPMGIPSTPSPHQQATGVTSTEVPLPRPNSRMSMANPDGTPPRPLPSRTPYPLDDAPPVYQSRSATLVP